MTSGRGWYEKAFGCFLVLGMSCGLAAADGPLLQALEQPSRSYAQALAAEKGADYAARERDTLRRAADVLLRGKRCPQATEVARQALSGDAAPGFADWWRLAGAAYCARAWQDAVFGAYLAFRGAEGDDQRSRALMLLGRSLEAHWAYGGRVALEAYRLAGEYTSDVQAQAQVTRLAALLEDEQALRLERVFTQTDAAAPALCLDFSASMPDPGEQRYADYLRIEPDFEPVFSKQADDEICAEGAEFGTDYRVRILPGLRALDGEQLGKPVERELQVGDRAPSLWFGNSRYVLPPGGGVPVHAINVPRARLALYRIGDRNLLHADIRRNFRSDIGRYQAERIREELGELIWRGEAELAQRRNREAVTNLSSDTLMQPGPGLYLLTAEPALEEGAEGALAAQWLVVSDIGMTTYRGSDGLTVVTRSLASAAPVADLELTLYARNNTRLGLVRPDADGVARFEAAALAGKGGREPVLLMAAGTDGDFNFLDISETPFDLSDRGVRGRPAPGPVDAFLYAERGVYRPGESVNLAALLRNAQGSALDGLPLTLRLRRPDDQEAAEQVVYPGGAGGYTTRLKLPPAARSGRWKVLAHLDREAAPVGETAFMVEAIVPPRIELDFSAMPDSPLEPDAEAAFSVQARYLFGAAAADLPASAEVRVAPDPDPYPAYPGFLFGPVDEPDDSVLLPLQGRRTGADGTVRFPFSLSRLPASRRPLRAELRAEVADVDGRAVALSRWVPVRHQPLAIGLKPPGQDGAVEEGSEARFEVMVLGPDDTPRAHPGLDYRVLREETQYHWYRDAGRWQYKRQVRDRVLQDGTLAVTAETPARLGFPVEFGSYRLEVRDPESGLLSSVRVRGGWGQASADTESPDMLGLRSDRLRYQPGEIAALQVEAPFAGTATLVIATDRVWSVRSVTLTERQQTLEVPVEREWGAGAYALVTAYRPDGGRTGHGPRRAVGLVWLGLDPEGRSLALSLEAPQRLRPRDSLEVKVRASGQQPDEPVFVTLAAVDEGVLRLTDHANPDPVAHYFGQRALAVGLRDLYGRLIDGREGSPGRIRSGGGASGRAGMPDTDVRIVSLFSGPVPQDGNGAGRVSLTLPEFDGRLRLMAVAWSAERVGSAAGEVTVRDPVVLMPSGPRFLATGDRSRASVLLHNLEGAEGDYRLSWHASGAVGAGDDQADQTLSLARDQRQVLTVPLEALAPGRGELDLDLQGPDGSLTRRQIAMGVRAPFLPQARRRFGRLAPGVTTTIGPELVEGLRRETVVATLSVSPGPDLDVPGLLRRLDLYPYGCLEQVTSRAFPLLHVQRLAERWDYASKVPVRQRLDDAVARILDQQLDDGAFALWRPGGEGDPWLSAYALDFLQRAREAGVDVPDFAWKRGLGWLRRQVTYPETGDAGTMAVQTYALYLLARGGEAHPETARYLLQEAGEGLPGPLAAAQLGAALALMGETQPAERAYALARRLRRDPGLGDYGSVLRDLAALALLEAEAGGNAADLAPLVQELSEAMGDSEWLSTQEQAWLVRAANAVSGADAPLNLAIGDRSVPERQGSLVLRPDAATLSRGLTLQNRGRETAWFSLTVDGSPTDAPPVLAAGLGIGRRWLDLQGRPVDPERLTQGDMLVALIEGKVNTSDLRHQALVVDPLPAGLEIENANLAHARSATHLDWLGRLSDTRYAEALDDRFVAALDLEPGAKAFRLAYLVRAVTPGRYRAPGPEVEDMYKPRYRGRGEAGWLHVAPGP